MRYVSELYLIWYSGLLGLSSWIEAARAEGAQHDGQQLQQLPHQLTLHPQVLPLQRQPRRQWLCTAACRGAHRLCTHKQVVWDVACAGTHKARPMVKALQD